MQIRTPAVAPTSAESDSPYPSGYVFWSMTSIVLGGYISVLNVHVINIVIPIMMSDLGADVVTIRWVVTAFMMANAVVIPLVGWASRTMGARELYILGLAVFTGSAVLCSMVSQVWLLIALRVVQGLGGGVIMPVTMLLMLDIFPVEKRGMGTAIWGMGASCGALTGIPLGGLVTEWLSWRAAFFINLPPGLLALVIAVFVMRRSPREWGVPFDWWGFLTLSTALVTLLMALSNGQRLGWDSTQIVTLFAVCGVTSLAFLLIESHVSVPLIDLTTFRSPPYVIAIVLSVIAGAMFNGGPFLLSLFLQQTYDLSVWHAALIMFPSSASMVLLTSVTGWATDRIDTRVLMVLGYLCYGSFGALMMLADLRLSLAAILFIYFGRGLGLGLSYPVLYPVGISGLPSAKGKAATTILNLCIVLGGALVVSLLAALLDQRHQVHQALLAETQTLPAIGTQHGLQVFEGLATQFEMTTEPAAQARFLLGRFVNEEALLLAFNDCFAVFLAISVAGIALALFFRRASQQI